jgi:hypothetical protein
MIEYTNVQVRMAYAPTFTPSPGLLQRKCACGGTPGLTGECAECSRKRLALQRRSGSEAHRSEAPPIVYDVLRSPGQSLSSDTRTSMESRFGHDFGHVRVHTNARAAVSARAVNAQAYTVGRDIVFAAGQYAPETTKGRRLLAHELAHVMQQSPDASTAETSTTTSLHISGGRASAPEAEADSAATAVTNEQPLTTSISRQGHSVQRQETTEVERRRWMGIGGQSMYQLHLDPEIEAQAMAFRLRGLLDPETIQLSLSRMDLESIIGYQPPPWVTAPPVPEPRPLVPRGAGPETSRPGAEPEAPRPAKAGDVLKAVMRIPAVDTALTRLRTEATDRLSSDWQGLSTGGKVAVITQSAVIGGGALAGVLSDPEARDFTLGLLQNRALPTGVPGLKFQFNITGPDQKIKFDLNVGALLPSTWGFK